MAFCSQCGTQLTDGAAFCPNCGTAVGPAPQQKQAAQQGPGLVDRIKNTKDFTEEFDTADIEQNKALALLSYLGVLVLIPIFCAKHSKFARFHANQGLVLAIASAATGILTSLCGILLRITWFFWLLEVPVVCLGLGVTAMAVLGIINAVRGKAKELPFIGHIRILR